jgi:hypothetical protein
MNTRSMQWLSAPILFLVLIVAEMETLSEIRFGLAAYRGSASMDLAWSVYLILHIAFLQLIPMLVVGFRFPSFVPSFSFYGWLVAANVICFYDGWHAFSTVWQMAC